jgi:hypothetical protein
MQKVTMQLYITFSMGHNITGNEMKTEQGSGYLRVKISEMKRGG